MTYLTFSSLVRSRYRNGKLPARTHCLPCGMRSMSNSRLDNEFDLCSVRDCKSSLLADSQLKISISPSVANKPPNASVSDRDSQFCDKSGDKEVFFSLHQCTSISKCSVPRGCSSRGDPDRAVTKQRQEPLMDLQTDFWVGNNICAADVSVLGHSMLLPCVTR